MRWPVIACVALVACGADETITGYAAPGTYVLQDVNGSVPGYSATLTLAANGAFSGQAPCNRYRGQSDVPYPWFATSPLATTRMACPELAAEAAYLAALESMTLVESSGAFLILSNDNNEFLTFSTK